jgi:general secretion pathway protein B
MSSILTALKKLEHEKTARKPDSFKIDAEILRGGSSRRSFSKGALLTALILFLCGGGATYLFMKHGNQLEPLRQSQIFKTEVKGESSLDNPQLSVSMRPAETSPARPSAPIISLPEKREYSPRSIEKQQNQRVQSAENITQPASSEPPKGFVSTPPFAPPVIPANPVLKVHGIAFQDGADSVAVVNGITVSKGSVIEGARVEEIQKDRVRFSRGAEKFEVDLDKSN